MNTNSGIGAELRELRTMLGWTMEYTIERAGGVVDVARLSRVERGVTGWSMKPNQIDAIRRVLEIGMVARAREFRQMVAGLENDQREAVSA